MEERLVHRFGGVFFGHHSSGKTRGRIIITSRAPIPRPLFTFTFTVNVTVTVTILALLVPSLLHHLVLLGHEAFVAQLSCILSLLFRKQC